LDSYELVAFVGVKGAWSGRREVDGGCKVISVGALLLSPDFLLCEPLDSPLLVMSFHMVKKSGELFFMSNFQIVVSIKCTICMKNEDFPPFYILCLTVLRDIPGVTSES